jgi:hypothetical protein
MLPASMTYLVKQNRLWPEECRRPGGKANLRRGRRFVAGLIGLALAIGSASAATLSVTNANDNLAGSLRQAIQDAEPGDTITFGFSQGSAVTISLTGGELLINKDLTISAAGRKVTIEKSSAPSTPLERIFNVTSGSVTLDSLTITKGYPQSPKGSHGAGVANAGNLTLRNCAIVDNKAGSLNGGSVHNIGTLTVLTSTIANNQTGGGIVNTGTLAVSDSTIVGNFNAGSAGGIDTTTTVQIRNTVVAKNMGGNPALDVGGPFLSAGYNFIGIGDGSTGFGQSGSHDQVGTHAFPADPKLGVLGDNGGSTQTMLPLSGSPLHDQGSRGTDPDGQPISTDQRGFLRPINSPNIADAGDGSDIGAVEVDLQQSAPTYTVTTTRAGNDGTCGVSDCTLVEAIVAANLSADANTITFAPAVTGLIDLFGAGAATGFAITSPLTIVGPGARALTITGETSMRLFRIPAGNAVKISGLKLTQAGVFPGNGGAISNLGNLTLEDCAISNSHAAGNDPNGLGGGIYSGSGAVLTLTRCTISGCKADAYGGGVYSEGEVTATNCTFTANTALRGGGIISRANGGAAKMTLRNCTFTANAATDGVASPGFGGGGVFAEGNNTQYFVANNIIAENTSTNDPDIRGNYTTQGSNLIGKVGDASGFVIDGSGNGDQVGTAGKPALARLDAFGNNGGPTDTWSLLPNSTAINSGNDNLAPNKDQRGLARNGTSDIGAFEFAGFVPVSLVNISTRLSVQTGDNVLIGGFIVTGSQPKKLVVRALGPSLPVFAPLQNPILEIYDSAGTQIATNDNWRTNANAAEIESVPIAPRDDLEATVLGTVSPAAYTAVERGVDGGTGVGLLEVYDLDRSADSKLANISTRGFVATGDDVIIGGFIVLGIDAANVIIRALGPSIPVAEALANPSLELRNENGDLLRANDNWRSDQAADIDATGIPPSDDLEAAIVSTLPEGAYTAVVRGVDNSVGVGLVEIYQLP